MKFAPASGLPTHPTGESVVPDAVIENGHVPTAVDTVVTLMVPVDVFVADPVSVKPTMSGNVPAGVTTRPGPHVYPLRQVADEPWYIWTPELDPAFRVTAKLLYCTTA